MLHGHETCILCEISNTHFGRGIAGGRGNFNDCGTTGSSGIGSGIGSGTSLKSVGPVSEVKFERKEYSHHQYITVGGMAENDVRV
jgi:hypothetical protein